MNNKRIAFTLAEVLITLGIIGVVAALTMPSLIQNYRKHVVETKLAKVYSVMNQALKNVSAEYGEPTVWMKDCGITVSPTCTRDEAMEWFKAYIGKHLNVLKIVPGSDTISNLFLVYFSDGSILSVNESLYEIVYYIDEKALKNVQLGKNAFHFRFNPLLKNQSIDLNIMKSNFEPYNHNWDGKRESLFTNEPFGCTKSGSYCTKLIQMNGWKIPKDYPIKF